MPHPADLRARVLRGDLTLGTFLNLGSAVVAEICGLAGFDWLLLDLEHGAGAEATVLHELQATSGTGAAPVVRVDRLDRLRIARALDLGATGIMVPRLETPDEAAEVVRYLRYPPHGVRGVALGTRGTGYGRTGHDNVVDLNASILGVVQVESPTSVENADAIAAVDGIDVLFVGPSDLTHAMGIPGQLDHPSYRSAIGNVGEAARRHGKAAGVLLWRIEDTDFYGEAGYTFFGISSDGAFIRQAAIDAVRSFRERSAPLKRVTPRAAG